MSEKKINKKAIFCVLILGVVLTSLMATVMSTTLPVIMDPASRAQMVTSIYALVSGITIIATAVIIKRIPTRHR